MELSSQKSSKPKEPSPPGSDLAVVGAIWVWGVMLSYFPTYAHVPAAWAWPFQLVSYICYAIGFFGAVIGLSNLLKSKFLENAGLGLVLGLVAYGLHSWANSLGMSVIAFLLRLIALMVAGLGVLGISMGIPYLFIRPQPEISPGALNSQHDSM